MLIDQFMPEFHVTEHHQILIPAPPEVVFAALYEVDLFDSAISRVLFWLRSLPARLKRRHVVRPERSHITLQHAINGGFLLLGEEAPTEVALGLVGRFWRYWMLIAPFSGLIRMMMLRALRRHVMSPAAIAGGA